MFTGYSLLHFNGQAQAQMQMLDYTAKPKIMNTLGQGKSKKKTQGSAKNNAQKPDLFLSPDHGPSAQNTATRNGAAMRTHNAEDPLGLSERNIDDNARGEIDRVFALYKALSEKQSAKAAEKPLKTNPGAASKHHQNRQSKAAAPSRQSASASPGGIGHILKRYQEKKQRGTATQTLNISNPDKFKSANK